jgi:WD40 repeat protein
LRFAPDQENLLLVIRDKIIQFCSEDNTEKDLKKFSSRITSFSSDSKHKLVVVGEDSGKISICKFPSMDSVSFQAYQNHRVKEFKLFPEHDLLITMSTEGMVSFWDVETLLLALQTLEGFDMNLEDKLQHLYEFQVDSRLICLDAKIDIKIGHQAHEVTKVKSMTVGKTYIEKLTKNKRKTRLGFCGGRVGAPQIRKLRKQGLIVKLKELRAVVPSN